MGKAREVELSRRLVVACGAEGLRDHSLTMQTGGGQFVKKYLLAIFGSFMYQIRVIGSESAPFDNDVKKKRQIRVKE